MICNDQSYDLCLKKEGDSRGSYRSALLVYPSTPLSLYDSFSPIPILSTAMLAVNSLCWFTCTRRVCVGGGGDKYLHTKNGRNCKHYHLHHTWDLPPMVLVQKDLQSAYEITLNVLKNSQKHSTPGMQTFSKNLGATSKF
jgi:hypothetical protein